MQLSLTRVSALLLAGGLVAVSMSSRAAGQQPTYSVASPNSQQQQINMLQEEIRSLRSEMNSLQGESTESLPPVGIGIGDFDPDYYIQDKDGKDGKDGKDSKDAKKDGKDAKKEKKSLDSRVADLEKSAKKASDAEKKKKAADFEKPTIKVRGRIHTDVAVFDQDALSRAVVGDIQDGADFRRARIGVEGTIFDITNYRIEMDFAGSGRPSFTDVYWGISELPYVNNFRAGHFKEPFGLEQLTSSNYTTFMERALPDALVPARNWGVATFDHFEGEWGTWAIGAFRTGSDDFGDDVGDSGEWSATGRVTAAPWYDEPSEGRYLFHVGSGYSYRDPDSVSALAGNGFQRYNSTPEIRMREDGVASVPNFVDTGNILATDVQLFNAEAALVYGAFSVQAEWINSTVDPFLPFAAGDIDYQGAYIYASYFLTGENRNYNRKIGAFDRQKVYEPFFCVCTPDGICKGSGAWEVAVRWSYLDLSEVAPAASQNTAGTYGYLDDITFGVNWYLNSYMRVMFNYIHADLNRATPVLAGDVDTDIYAMRFDVHF